MERLISIKDLQVYCGIGRNSALNLAKNSGARVKLGSRLLVDKQIIDQWIDRNRE
ncbi:MAG: polyprenyl synthetase solanesyl diphosphate synthase [Paenibacillaceae bacterium]|nr:polyprenyl synthetase solanesyl diphosphate synthase [Paenibacillaceae bacterium]